MALAAKPQDQVKGLLQGGANAGNVKVRPQVSWTGCDTKADSTPSRNDVLMDYLPALVLQLYTVCVSLCDHKTSLCRSKGNRAWLAMLLNSKHKLQRKRSASASSGRRVCVSHRT